MDGVHDEEMQKFKERVTEMMKLDDDIDTANNMIKELRKRKSSMQSEVLAFMQERNVRSCNTASGKLTLSTTRRGVAPSKEEVAQSVATQLGIGVERMEEAFEQAKKAKRFVESVSLRRTKPRAVEGGEDEG
jgi:predicted HicB family RNase H-like nuclease